MFNISLKTFHIRINVFCDFLREEKKDKKKNEKRYRILKKKTKEKMKNVDRETHTDIQYNKNNI